MVVLRVELKTVRYPQLRSKHERQFWYKQKNDDALFMVTTSKTKEERVGRAHTENRTPWASEEMMQGGCRDQEEGREGG